MKFIPLAILFVLSMNSFGQSVPVSHVITHNRKTIVTDPSQGANPYPAWGVFPDTGTPIRKILMHITLGTPDSLSTAHWDYRDHINILRTGGAMGPALNLEIGRMLTPYGSIYSTGWEFTWTVDVTDFSLVLRDSVEIEYIHSGYEPTSVGWALTIDFEITQGPPHIIPLQIQALWNGSFNYGNPEKPIEKELLPMRYVPDSKSVINRLRIQHTGHGMDQPRGCSEFCSRWREILFNGEVVQTKDLWKKCGTNPLYPQGGTWIFDRALWCPGDLQQPDLIDVNPVIGENTFSIRMEPYTATENIQAQEFIAACLIQYSAPVNDYDVAIDEIMVPNKRALYNRSNPKNFGPRVLIRNLGRKNLKSVTITYGTEGFPKKSYQWKGNLAYNASEEVVLPGSIDFKASDNSFVVELRKPNGKKDAWEGDNQLTSQFKAPMALPEQIIIQYQTNSQPEENQVFIIGENQDTLYAKMPADVEPQTLYTDTLSLPKALYEMVLVDTAGQGLEFWYMVRQGYGFLRILDTNGSLLHTFTADCGAGEQLAFHTEPDYVKDPKVTLYDFAVFPKMVRDTFSLEVYTEKEVEMEVVLMSLGVPVEKHYYPKTKGGKFKYDISHLPDNRYILEVYIDGVLKHKSRCNKATR